MGRTVQELTATMSSAEWTEWLAFSKLRPFGESGADLRSGVMAAAVTRWLGNREASAIRYMPVQQKLEEAAESLRPKTPEELQAKLQGMFGGMAQKSRAAADDQD